tara:strand:+ start:507 stop:1016 length:510 start_codon:yes stop_codon:yes gene_type:complete
MALDISGLYFFMPVFSFLFVFFIIYALLATSKVLGESKFVHILISFIVSVVFMSFSSAELYVRKVIPWFVILIVVVFLILMIAGFTKNLEAFMKPWFAWVIIIVLGIIFLISAINVFNPVFHPDLVVTSSEAGPGVVQQFKDFLISSKVIGSIILLVVAVVVSWVVTKK